MSYKENGYVLFKDFYHKNEVIDLHSVVLAFHEAWKKDNSEFYSQRAINSAYLTGTKYLNDEKRLKLFQFIGSSKLMKALSSVLPNDPMFMNTQLFFNPVNKDQKNYWHRDPQYHLSPDEQKAALAKSSVVHFRIPLMDEPGIELIPGTHIRWDSEEELEVRLEKNGRKNYENLSTGKSIRLEAGDLLVFSANMIHRGLYGMDRLSLDILFCDPDPEFKKYIDNNCLPSKETLALLENPWAFKNTISCGS